MADNKTLDILPTLGNASAALKTGARNEIIAVHKHVEAMLKKYCPQLVMDDALRTWIAHVGWQEDDTELMPMASYICLFAAALALMSAEETTLLNSLVVAAEAKITADGFVVSKSRPWWLPHYAKFNENACCYYVQVMNGDTEMMLPFVIMEVDAKLEFSDIFMAEVKSMRRVDATKAKYAVYSISKGQDEPALLHASAIINKKVIASILKSLYKMAYTGTGGPDIEQPVEPPAELISRIRDARDWKHAETYANRAFCLPDLTQDEHEPLSFPIGFLKDHVFIYATKVSPVA